MSIKESLQKIRKNLESAQAEIANLYDLVESLEETVGGPTARETTPAPKKQSKPKASRGTATERVLARIEGSPAGISSDAIIKETGLEWITALRAPQTLKLNPRDSRLLFMAIRRLLAFGYDRVIKGFDESDFC